MDKLGMNRKLVTHDQVDSMTPDRNLIANILDAVEKHYKGTGRLLRNVKFEFNVTPSKGGVSKIRGVNKELKLTGYIATWTVIEK